MITNAVILAGGLGTRLRSVVADQPKVLAPVLGRPFITYLLDQVAQAGIRDVVLCTGYLGEQVQTALGNTYGPLHLAYSQETELMGTGGALRIALPLLKTDPVLVLNGDSYCEADLPAFYRQHQAVVAEASLLLMHLPDTGRYSCVEIDTDGCVLRFEEKGQSAAAGWINAGIYLLSRMFLQAIPSGRFVSLEKEMFPAWIGRGLYGFSSKLVDTEEHFLDIGIPEDYAAAERFFHP
jgi:NDP-sugar pyrophosphorylase family protein